jgi:hypothetical protein
MTNEDREYRRNIIEQARETCARLARTERKPEVRRTGLPPDELDTFVRWARSMPTAPESPPQPRQESKPDPKLDLDVRDQRLRAELDQRTDVTNEAVGDFVGRVRQKLWEEIDALSDDVRELKTKLAQSEAKQADTNAKVADLHLKLIELKVEMRQAALDQGSAKVIDLPSLPQRCGLN